MYEESVCVFTHNTVRFFRSKPEYQRYRLDARIEAACRDEYAGLLKFDAKAWALKIECWSLGALRLTSQRVSTASSRDQDHG